MNFERLTAFRPRLERALRTRYAGERRGSDREFSEYWDLLEEFTLRGGKRFRALLVLAGYHLATGKDPSPALPAAAALEHFQSWMLIHDDIIDHSELRRGGPALYRSIEARVRASGAIGDPVALGVGLGITLGDLEEPVTVRSLLATRVPAARRLRALEAYARMARQTALGQLLDIRNGTLPVERVREEDVLTVHLLKSAVYTVAGPLEIGAVLGGASPALVRDLWSFGSAAGVAFQLRDDVLGAGLSATQAEKSANDVVEGKRTLLVVDAWRLGDAADRRAIGRVLGNPRATPAQVDAAREALRRSGAVERSEKRIRELSDRARARVRRSRAVRPAHRPLLEEIADRLTVRSV
ncbi:MAG TPA: polyprenyl synthetase family protein [Thermoplasmata archaeon]|nr:polyprenyl synthetase family protein [Thermoplasmata archaeon]